MHGHALPLRWSLLIKAIKCGKKVCASLYALFGATRRAQDGRHSLRSCDKSPTDPNDLPSARTGMEWLSHEALCSVKRLHYTTTIIRWTTFLCGTVHGPICTYHPPSHPPFQQSNDRCLMVGKLVISTTCVAREAPLTERRAINRDTALGKRLIWLIKPS